MKFSKTGETNKKYVSMMKKAYLKIVKSRCNHDSRSAFSMWGTPGNELATPVVTLYKDKSYLPIV